MIKKIFTISLLLSLIFFSCKEQGDSYLSWRSINNQNMINIHGAILQVRALKDSLLFKGTKEAIIGGEITFKDDSFKIIKFGHCLSAINIKPVLKSIYTNDTLERAIVYEILDTGIWVLGKQIFQTTTSFQFQCDFNNLKVDRQYYVRTFVVVENVNSKKIDTAYNSVVSEFRTKVPQDIWFHKPDFNGDARTEAVSFTYGNVAFIGTGYNNFSLLKDFWSYNPTGGIDGNGSWTQVSTPSSNFESRKSAVAMNYTGDTVIVGLGIVNVTTLEASRYLKKYAIDDNNWETQPVDSFPYGSESYDAVGFGLKMIDGTVRAYVCGGRQKIQSNQQIVTFNDLYYYFPEADTPGHIQGTAWRVLDDFPGGKRTEAVAAVINNVAVVGSGTDENNNVKNDFYKFDPTLDVSGKWVSLGSSSVPPRANAVAFAMAFTRNSTAYKYFYFGTGRGTTGNLYNDWWRYDFVNGQWFQCSDIIDVADTADARQGGIGFSITKQHVEYGTLERGFIGLGINASGHPLKDIWEYLP